MLENRLITRCNAFFGFCAELCSFGALTYLLYIAEPMATRKPQKSAHTIAHYPKLVVLFPLHLLNRLSFLQFFCFHFMHT